MTDIHISEFNIDSHLYLSQPWVYVKQQIEIINNARMFFYHETYFNIEKNLMIESCWLKNYFLTVGDR